MSDVSEDLRRLRQLDFFEGREFAGSDGAPPRSDELIDARDLGLGAAGSDQPGMQAEQRRQLAVGG